MKLSVDRPQNLFGAYELTASGARVGVSLQTLLDWRLASNEATDSSLVGLAAYRQRTFGISTPGSSELDVVRIGMVTGDFFDVLGVSMTSGRGFSQDDVINAQRFIVLSEPLRRRLFEGEGSVVGALVELNEMQYTVIGVLEQSFDFPIQAGRTPLGGGGFISDAFIPLSHADYGGRRQVRNPRSDRQKFVPTAMSRKPRRSCLPWRADCLLRSRRPIKATTPN